VIANINDLVGRARAADVPVVWVQHPHRVGCPTGGAGDRPHEPLLVVAGGT
jgi:nicotinamidase-related amidase